MTLRTTQQHVSVLAPGDGDLRVTQQHVSVLAPGDGDLRVTQQHVSVLAPGDGNLRATRQYVEVLYSWNIQSPENSLSLTATSVGIRNTSPEVSVVTEILLLDEVSRRGAFYQDVTSFLDTGEVEETYIYDDDGNLIDVIQTPIGLHHSVTISGTYNDRVTGSFIGIKDTVSYLKIPAIGTDKTASSTISWTDTVYDSLGASNTISTTHTAIGLGYTGAEHGDIQVSQSVFYSMEGTRSPISTIDVEHAVSYFVVTDDFCDYEIFIGSTTSTGLPTEPVQPTIVPVNRISFAFPYDTPTTTLYFDRPEWGNIHEIFQRRLDRESRGGKRIIYRNSTWRKHEIIKITFTMCTESEAVNLITFLTNSAGDRVKYTDYESREWEVIILNPSEQIVRDKIANTVSIEMETV